MAYNPIVVTLSSLQPFFFNSLKTLLSGETGCVYAAKGMS